MALSSSHRRRFFLILHRVVAVSILTTSGKVSCYTSILLDTMHVCYLHAYMYWNSFSRPGELFSSFFIVCSVQTVEQVML